MGNRIGVTHTDLALGGIEKTSYRYDDDDRLVSEVGSQGATSYEYDKAGNLVRKTAPDADPVEYAWAVENRLAAVRQGGRVLMAATYDGDGNKVLQSTLYHTDEIQRSDLPADATAAASDFTTRLLFGTALKLPLAGQAASTNVGTAAVNAEDAPDRSRFGLVEWFLWGASHSLAGSLAPVSLPAGVPAALLAEAALLGPQAAVIPCLAGAFRRLRVQQPCSPKRVCALPSCWPWPRMRNRCPLNAADDQAPEAAQPEVTPTAGAEAGASSEAGSLDENRAEMETMLNAMALNNVTVDTKMVVEAGADGVNGSQTSDILVKVATDSDDPRAYYRYDMPGTELDGVEMYVTSAQLIAVADGTAVDTGSDQAEIDALLASSSDLTSALVPIQNATGIEKTEADGTTTFHVVSDPAALSTQLPTDGFDGYTSYEADYTFDADGKLLAMTMKATGTADQSGTEVQLTMTTTTTYSDYGTTVVEDAPEPVQ